MNFANIKNIYFIGIGGIGISALANILHENNFKISGSEINKSEITDNLKDKGVQIVFKQIEENINKETDLIIYTPAVDFSHPEVKKAKEEGINCLSYPEALGEFGKNYTLIAISGTHGKSTITAMLSKIFIEANLDPNIIIGTKTKELNGKNYRVGKSKYLIIEACEYKESFLNFHPDYLIINNIEADHLDYFKTEENYINTFRKLLNNIKKGGTLITHEDFAKLLKINQHNFNTITWRHTEKFKLKVAGKFNQQNAQNAYLLASLIDIDKAQVIKSLENFEGSWRRMEYKKTKFENKIFIDDYAHHPTEIKVTLKAIKEKYTNKKILTIFQPHQFNRTKHFLNEFAKSFKNTKKVIIPNIYKVRDNKEDTKDLNAEKLVEEINKNSNNAIFINGINNAANYIKEKIENYDIFITMGAGDITNIYKFF